MKEQKSKIIIVIIAIILQFVAVFVIRGAKQVNELLNEKVSNISPIIEEKIGVLKRVQIRDPFQYGIKNDKEFVYDAFFVTEDREDSYKEHITFTKITTYEGVKNPICILIDGEEINVLPNFELKDYQKIISKNPIEENIKWEDYKDIVDAMIRLLSYYSEEKTEMILYYDSKTESWFSESKKKDDEKRKFYSLITKQGNGYIWDSETIIF